MHVYICASIKYIIKARNYNASQYVCVCVQDAQLKHHSTPASARGCTDRQTCLGTFADRISDAYKLYSKTVDSFFPVLAIIRVLKYRVRFKIFNIQNIVMYQLPQPTGPSVCLGILLILSISYAYLEKNKQNYTHFRSAGRQIEPSYIHSFWLAKSTNVIRGPRPCWDAVENKATDRTPVFLFQEKKKKQAMLFGFFCYNVLNGQYKFGETVRQGDYQIEIRLNMGWSDRYN